MPTPVKLEEHLATDMAIDHLYNAILQPQTAFGKRMATRWTKYCSANVPFLQDTQKLLKSELPIVKHDCSRMESIRQKIGRTEREDHADEEGFHAKYQYMEWEPLMFLNQNRTALQYMSIYNLASPVLSLCLPIICMIVPFFIIRMRGISISMASYIEVLQVVLQKHQLGQLFTFSSASWDKRIYIILSAGFYALSIYQNVRSCARFYANMGEIHSDLQVVRSHIDASIEYIEHFGQCVDECQCRSYDPMRSTNGVVIERAKLYREKLDKISPSVWSRAKVFEIGHVMECFYELHHDQEVRDLLEYTCNFCGYIDNLTAVKRGISTGKLGPCKFECRKDKFYDAYLPGNTVTNTYSIMKHSLITGPNAAGKTTLLKSTLFNVILSQQFGYGCYRRASLRPYQHIHCYLNIPDTNGRDSLFQSEARRCKRILDSVENNVRKERHFCVFDELYSGTNPYEAVGSAVAFLKHLNQYPNVTLMLTTHFIDICTQLDPCAGFRNRHMTVSALSGEFPTDNTDLPDFKYLYKIADGISTIKGGVRVLKELDYPAQIINSAYEIINQVDE